MVSLHIAKLLEEAGFGTLDVDIFWDEAPLTSSGKPAKGIWVVTRGSSVDRTHIEEQAFDIYARYPNKLDTARKLEEILHFLQEAYGSVCELPLVPPYSMNLYYNCMIEPTSSVDRVITDEQDMIVKVVSGQISYNLELPTS